MCLYEEFVFEEGDLGFPQKSRLSPNLPKFQLPKFFFNFWS